MNAFTKVALINANHQASHPNRHAALIGAYAVGAIWMSRKMIRALTKDPSNLS